MTKKAPSRERDKVTQAEHRRSINVGPEMGQVSPPTYWYNADFFANEEEARGAFKLAHQQGLDGLGASVQEWMGLSDAEFNAWMRDDALPKKPRR